MNEIVKSNLISNYALFSTLNMCYCFVLQTFIQIVSHSLYTVSSLSLLMIFFFLCEHYVREFPRLLSGKQSTCQHRRHKRCASDPWVGKIPWSRNQQPTPVLLPGKFHGQRNLAGATVQGGHKELDTTEHALAVIFLFLCEHCTLLKVFLAIHYLFHRTLLGSH